MSCLAAFRSRTATFGLSSRSLAFFRSPVTYYTPRTFSSAAVAYHLSIPKTQTAVVFREHKGPLEVRRDHPVTQQKDLKPGEALVNVKVSGVCHSDLHAWKGDWPAAVKLPLVGGHEGAGIIVALGDGTSTNHKVGDAVGIKWLADSCLDCEPCRSGEEATCDKAVISGYQVDGSFQQYAVSFTRHLTPIPAGLPLEEAAPILCAGVTVLKAIKQSNTKPGDYILIAGAGVQYAAAMQLRVIAVDTGAAKEALCRELGAETFLDFKAPGDFIERVKAVTGGLGPHAAVIASPVGASYTEALDYLRPHGTLVAVGLPPKAFIEASVFNTVFKALRIVGSYVGNRQDAIEALDFAARGKVKAIIRVEPLEKLGSIFEEMEKGGLAGRVVLKCS